MEIINVTKKTVVGNKIKLADTFLLRLIGLLGKRTLAQGEGLLLQPCRGVHGLGMRFSCDVLYLDQENKVVHIMRLDPGKPGPYLKNAVKVLEVPAGMIKDSHTGLGDVLAIR